jgi:hypothetical protein
LPAIDRSINADESRLPIARLLDRGESGVEQVDGEFGIIHRALLHG